MKSSGFYRALVFATVVVALNGSARNVSFAADTNRGEIQSETNRFERWRQLTTDAVKALRNNQLPIAIRLCDEAQALSATFGSTNICFSRTEVLRAEVYLWEGNRPKAEQTFQQAVASCEKVAGTNALELVYPLSSQANYYYFVDRHLDRVAEIFEKILNIVQSSSQSSTRDRIMWSRNLGKIHQERKQYEKAEPLFAQSIELCQRGDAEWLPYELLNAADFYRDWGKADQAEALGQRALSIREQALATGGLDAQGELTTCLANLGATYLAGHEPEKAEAHFRRAIEILAKIAPSDASDFIPHLLGLGLALQTEKKYEAAEPLFQRALAIAEKNPGADDNGLAEVLEKYAALLKDINKSREAEAMLARAQAIRRRGDPPRFENSPP